MSSAKNPVCRHHFGDGTFFRYQSKLYALEAVWRRKLRLTTRHGNGQLLTTRFLALLGRLKSLPFTSPKKIIRPEAYLDFGRPYWDVQIRHTTRPAIVSLPEETITTSLRVPEKGVLRFGIGLLETTDRAALEGNMMVSLKLGGEKGTRQISFRFLLNRKFKGTYEVFYDFGRNWADNFTDLPDLLAGHNITLELSAYFEKKNQKIPVAPLPSIAWSSPQIIVRRPETQAKKIVILLYEAMSDPLFLEKRFNKTLHMPHYRRLMEDSLVAPHSYSQNDSTLGSVGTILTGLYASQHGISDYRSNAEIYETPTLSPTILTLPEILKKKGFLTIGGSTTGRLNPAYGWSRGFDSYLNVAPPWADTVPDEGWATRALESMKGHDGFLFLYLDWLHWPTITFSHNRTPICHSTALLEEASKASQTPTLYFDRLSKLDERLGEIVSYLKESRQYDNTLLFVTGDHGSYLEPWGYHERYAFYEHHIRVPSLVKLPNWSQATFPGWEGPVKASTQILSTTLQCLNEPFPDYWAGLPQKENSFQHVSITETVMHPKPDDYAVTLISRHFKYVLFAKVDWSRSTLTALEGERLYKVDAGNGLVDESNDQAGTSPDLCQEWRERAIRFLQTNLEFRKKHPARNFRTDLIGWSPKKIGPLKKGLSHTRGYVTRWLR